MAEFSAKELYPGVVQVRDPLGVNMTLLIGREQVLLFDAGYGILDLHAFVRLLTSLPLTLVLSHGHHDHALGAMHFPVSLMLPEDLPVFREYTGLRQRSRIAGAAGLEGQAKDAYFSAGIREPQALSCDFFDLGGLSARIFRTPGHTPGSLAVYVPERELLLLGDNWNPQTWIFFPESPGVRTYAESFRSLMTLPFRTALAPHAENILERDFLLRFADGLNETGFASAKPVRIQGYEHLPARAFEPVPGAMLVFRD